jgi:hypothetical protein
MGYPLEGGYTGFGCGGFVVLGTGGQGYLAHRWLEKLFSRLCINSM